MCDGSFRRIRQHGGLRFTDNCVGVDGVDSSARRGDLVRIQHYGRATAATSAAAVASAATSITATGWGRSGGNRLIEILGLVFIRVVVHLQCDSLGWLHVDFGLGLDDRLGSRDILVFRHRLDNRAGLVHNFGDSHRLIHLHSRARLDGRACVCRHAELRDLVGDISCRVGIWRKQSVPFL